MYNTIWNYHVTRQVSMEFSCVFAQVELPWKTFAKKTPWDCVWNIPWNFHETFLMVVPYGKIWKLHGDPCSMEYSMWNFMESRWSFMLLALVKLRWKTFSFEIPWNNFHWMFSTLIPWSIKLGPLRCRIAVFVSAAVLIRALCVVSCCHILLTYSRILSHKLMFSETRPTLVFYPDPNFFCNILLPWP